MYQCSKKLVAYKEYCCFDHSDFPSHLMFTSDVCWGSLGTSIFGKSSSVASNTRSRLPSRLSFRFIWLWFFRNPTRGKTINKNHQKVSVFSYNYNISTEFWSMLCDPTNICNGKTPSSILHICSSSLIILGTSFSYFLRKFANKWIKISLVFIVTQ